MNQATIRALSQVGELVKEEKHDPRQKFIREKDAVRVYCMSRPKIQEEALKAGAFYKIGGVNLINVKNSGGDGMSLAERKLNHEIREKILSLDPTDIRVEYFRPDEGMRIYHVGRGVIMDLAEEANALYRVGRNCIINKKLFDENFQKYKVTSERKRK